MQPPLSESAAKPTFKSLLQCPSTQYTVFNWAPKNPKLTSDQSLVLTLKLSAIGLGSAFSFLISSMSWKEKKKKKDCLGLQGIFKRSSSKSPYHSVVETVGNAQREAPIYSEPAETETQTEEVRAHLSHPLMCEQGHY